MENLWIYGVIVLALILFVRTFRVIPEASVYIVEELGKFKKILNPGFHIVVPILQRVAYVHDLKEQVIDVPPQMCITQDNVQVRVDGVLYVRVVDPIKASYGIENYKFATIQLAQTTMRSEVGKIELDISFSERETINNSVVKSIDVASEPWGIKVTRYEIRDIEPTASIITALEQQVAAERQKRAEILESEGNRESRINLSKGEREEAVNLSKGERQKRINEAEGQAQSMEIIARASAEGVKIIAQAIEGPRGRDARMVQIINKYLRELRNILETSKVNVLPMEAANLQSIAQVLTNIAGGKQ